MNAKYFGLRILDFGLTNMRKHFGFWICDFGLTKKTASPPARGRDAGFRQSKIQNPKSKMARRAFTMIELLVVITIIAILMALSVQVVGAFLTQARSTATETTIRKIHGVL